MDADIVAALNGLLEEERAGVETLVGLVAMATDPRERQALTAMGGQATDGCIELRAWLERLGVPISLRVAHSVGRVLGRERIDDRLRAFGEVRRYLAGRCEALQERNLDDGTRTLLAALSSVQRVHAAWAEHRADEFAATRPSEADSSSPSHSTPRGERGSVRAVEGAAEAVAVDTLEWAQPDAEEEGPLSPLTAGAGADGGQMIAGGTEALAEEMVVEEPPAVPRPNRRTTKPPTKPRVRRTTASATTAKRRGKPPA